MIAARWPQYPICRFRNYSTARELFLYQFIKERISWSLSLSISDENLVGNILLGTRMVRLQAELGDYIVMVPIMAVALAVDVHRQGEDA